jgi:hypothetical protein
MSGYYPDTVQYTNDFLAGKSFISLAEYKKGNAEANYISIVLLTKKLPKSLIHLIIGLATDSELEANKLNIFKRDMSDYVLSRLYKSIKEKNTTEFKRIYDEEYINNPIIRNTFNYRQEYKGCCWDDYELCTCPKTEPIRVWKDLYTRDCTCAHGKRYLMFISLYTEIREVLHLSNRHNYHEIYAHVLNSGPIDKTYTGEVPSDIY